MKFLRNAVDWIADTIDTARDEPGVRVMVGGLLLAAAMRAMSGAVEIYADQVSAARERLRKLEVDTMWAEKKLAVVNGEVVQRPQADGGDEDQAANDDTPSLVDVD